MNSRYNHTSVIAVVGAQCFSMIAAVATAVHYVRAAQKDERNGFRYAAAMEWQLAAGLFASNTLAAEYCWWQWERISRLPRQFAGPIGDSRPVFYKERISVMQSEMERSNDQICLTSRNPQFTQMESCVQVGQL